MASEQPGSGRFPFVRDRVAYALLATLVTAVLVIVAFQAGVLTVPAGTTAFVQSLLERYGLPALFVVFIAEGAMLLYFAPSESLVPAAVLLLGDTTTDIAAIIGIAVLGATIGQTGLFLLAKRGGHEVLRERRWIAISEDNLDRFEDWFKRWGPIVVPVSNTLLFTRGMATIPAGFAEMDTRAFAVLSAVGTLSFELILAGLTLGVTTWV